MLYITWPEEYFLIRIEGPGKNYYPAKRIAPESVFAWCITVEKDGVQGQGRADDPQEAVDKAIKRAEVELNRRKERILNIKPAAKAVSLADLGL